MKKALSSIGLGILIVTISFLSGCSGNENGADVEISTEYGLIQIKLYDETPAHKENFLKLTREGYFNGKLFHRVIKEFMVQGGDPDSKGAPADKQLGEGGPGYTIPAEILPQFYHKKGALAAARQSDQVNPKRESSGSQFYLVHGRTFTDANLQEMEQQQNDNIRRTILGEILEDPANKELTDRYSALVAMRNTQGLQQFYADVSPLIEERFAQKTPFTYTAEQRNIYTTFGGAPHLDGQYTIFGEIVLGMEVLDMIGNASTGPGDRPQKDIPMQIRVIGD